tara:strand:+ start:132 stop:581 length:450 start_codon:yes stop_codon:yes gene_type:complete
MEDLPKYRNPIWIDKSIRSLRCQIWVETSDGADYVDCTVTAGPAEEGYVNEDYDAIMETIGEEMVDENTAVWAEEEQKRKDRHLQEHEIHKSRIKQETLFNMKLEALAIPEIKESKNKEIKKKIRKAKTLIEVQAYSTILLFDELPNVK